MEKAEKVKEAEYYKSMGSDPMHVVACVSHKELVKKYGDKKGLKVWNSQAKSRKLEVNQVLYLAIWDLVQAGFFKLEFK